MAVDPWRLWVVDDEDFPAFTAAMANRAVEIKNEWAERSENNG